MLQKIINLLVTKFQPSWKSTKISFCTDPAYTRRRIKWPDKRLDITPSRSSDGVRKMKSTIGWGNRPLRLIATCCCTALINVIMGVHRGGQEGALAPPPAPSLADQNSMFFDFLLRKVVSFWVFFRQILPSPRKKSADALERNYMKMQHHVVNTCWNSVLPLGSQGIRGERPLSLKLFYCQNTLE